MATSGQADQEKNYKNDVVFHTMFTNGEAIITINNMLPPWPCRFLSMGSSAG